MNISDLMTSISAGVNPDTSLADAVRMMFERQCSCVIVSENDDPKGIITERDVVRFYVEGLEADTRADIPVSEVMTRDPVCVPQFTSLSDALVLANSRRLRHLLVVDDQQKLVGLVTQTDMVDAYVRLIERQVELESKNKELHLLSNEDALMGIANRRAMEVDLDFTQASAKRYKTDYAVALLDVDFFKKYNDCYGHQMGDDALKKLASIIKASKRESDRIYRYGGEEVLLLMPETDRAEALVAAERVRQAVEGSNIPHQESPNNKLTISIGVAAAENESWKELINRADQALYEAKNAGRNKVCEWQ